MENGNALLAVTSTTRRSVTPTTTSRPARPLSRYLMTGSVHNVEWVRNFSENQLKPKGLSSGRKR